MRPFAVRAPGALAGVVLVLCVGVYAGSEIMLRHRYPLPAHPAFVVHTTADAAIIERGRRLAGSGRPPQSGPSR